MLYFFYKFNGMGDWFNDEFRCVFQNYALIYKKSKSILEISILLLFIYYTRSVSRRDKMCVIQ